LTATEIEALAVRVAEALEGAPLGPALHVLATRVPQLLHDGHVVRAIGPGVRTARAGAAAAPGERSDGSAGATDAVPFDPDAYGPWEAPVYSADTRHIRWLHEVLTAGRFRRVLEIGCFEGRSTTALLDAGRAGRVDEVHLCEPNPRAGLQRVLTRFEPGVRVTLHCEPSEAVLGRDGRWDLVYVDGDHTVATVRAETALLLRAGVPAVFAHDTSAHGRHAHCEGPQFLKAAFQAAGYWTLEDSLFRPGEQTDRGMFFATSRVDLYEIALRAYRRHCTAPV